MMVTNKKYFINCLFVSTCMFLLLYKIQPNIPPDINLQSLMLFKLKLDLKYILVWTLPTKDPIINLDMGLKSFMNKRCSVINCYVSSNRQLLKDVADFDVIVFHGPDLTAKAADLPHSRSSHQKYIFASMESSGYYPNHNKMYNGYFNWTWTYKLKSDEYYGYIIIRNKEGAIIGPREEMHWEKAEAMKPINETLKVILGRKTIAAAWFVSNCNPKNGRDFVAIQLMTELAAYNMVVDIYGVCGTKVCPRENMSECWRKLERAYYFYFAFENSFSEDYVTEKLLHALKHYAVPVVYGGANYTRFMPDGIYLDAKKQSIHELAKTMVNIINDKQLYYTFFKWHNHYSYHNALESPETDPYCNLCAMINDQQYFNATSVYDDFTWWWND